LNFFDKTSGDSDITPRLNVTSADVGEEEVGDFDNRVENDVDAVEGEIGYFDNNVGNNDDSEDDSDFNSSDGDNEDSDSSSADTNIWEAEGIMDTNDEDIEEFLFIQDSIYPTGFIFF